MRPTKTGAGDLPFRMTIQRNVGTTRDAAGRATPVWQEYSKVWGGEEITTGREFVQAQQVKAEITSIVKCRYISGVTSGMRLIPKTGSSRVLQIIAVRNIGSFNVELELWCKEAL